MKKALLVAAMAATMAAANAQYTVNPELKTITDKGTIESMQWLILDSESQKTVSESGAKVESWAPNNVGRNLYIWEATFLAHTSTYPGVGMHFDGYVSLDVASKGWSGAGYNIGLTEPVSTANWNDQTRFHIAYMSEGVSPASVTLILADGGNNTDKGSPAKVTVGAAGTDAGKIVPSVGPQSKDDWQGIDLSFADLKKLFPSFTYKVTDTWNGNIFSFLAGAVTGTNIALDACYFYNLKGSGVEDLVADNVNWMVTSKTVNLNGGMGIELFDLNGKLVKATEGAALGLGDLASGVYVARHGQSSTKVVVK